MNIINKLFFLAFLTGCVVTPKTPTDIDWDYVFPGDDVAEYCETEIEEDCLYYPPYYYN